jgi:hypothetical protein
MNRLSVQFKRGVCTAALLLVCGSSFGQQIEAGSAPVKPVQRRASQIWIERPWEIRYFLMVTDSWSTLREGAIRRATKPSNTWMEWESVFDPTASVLIPNPLSPRTDRFSVVPIEFDQHGTVLSPHTHKGPLRGRLNQLVTITLSAGDAIKDPRYDLGHWFLGLGDVSTDWAPALCKTDQQPDAAQVRSDGYLYGAKFKVDKYSTTFGCREWAYQLYDSSRPYIDVTSYIPRAKDKGGTGTYIREFIGWARFDDKKPVIGKHEDQWYCLHDCPNGDKPGAIANIATWASKNGWQVPQRPTRMPMFPDPPGKIGRYPE